MSGKPHFYQRILPLSKLREIMCQCPMSGKPHFYSDLVRWEACVDGCVNALCRASLISTLIIFIISILVSWVSMPYVGQASFLPCLLRRMFYQKLYIVITIFLTIWFFPPFPTNDYKIRIIMLLFHHFLPVIWRKYGVIHHFRSIPSIAKIARL